MSPTVHNLLVNKGILKAEKVKAFNIPKKKEEPKAETTQPAEAAPETETKTEQQPEEVKAE